jgi:hypothetical protein
MGMRPEDLAALRTFKRSKSKVGQLFGVLPNLFSLCIVGSFRLIVRQAKVERSSTWLMKNLRILCFPPTLVMMTPALMRIDYTTPCSSNCYV